MGTALLILAEIFAWGMILVLIGATLETLWARIRRRKGDTLVE